MDNDTKLALKRIIIHVVLTEKEQRPELHKDIMTVAQWIDDNPVDLTKLTVKCECDK